MDEEPPGPAVRGSREPACIVLPSVNGVDLKGSLLGIVCAFAALVQTTGGTDATSIIAVLCWWLPWDGGHGVAGT